jgi:hypothetical protein
MNPIFLSLGKSSVGFAMIFIRRNCVVLSFVLISLLIQVVNCPHVSAQKWCWVGTLDSTSEAGSPQSVCTDNFGGVFGYSPTYHTPTIAGVVITSGKCITKQRGSDGAIVWAKDGVGGTWFLTYLATDDSGNLFVYYDSSFYYHVLTKLDSSGNTMWSTTVNFEWDTVSLPVSPRFITTDHLGNVYLSGDFTLGYLYVGSDTLINTVPYNNTYVAKFDGAGHKLWVKAITSPGNANSFALATDPSNNLMITGLVDTGTGVGYSPVVSIFDTTVTLPFSTNGRVTAKLDTSRRLQWVSSFRNNCFYDSHYYGHNNFIRTDGAGNAYVAASYLENDTIGSIPIIYSGSRGVFVAKYKSVDGSIAWAKTGGTTYGSRVFGFAANKSGNSTIVLAADYTGVGTFGTSSFTVIPGPYSWNVIIVKLDSSGNVTCGTMEGGAIGDDGCSIAIDDQGSCFLNGDFYGACPFGIDTTLVTTGEKYFIAKLTCHCTCNEFRDTIGITASPGDTICPGTTVRFTATTGLSFRILFHVCQ